MKKVLITGAGSYIGTKVKEWLAKYPEEYQIAVLDMLDEKWTNESFSGFDVVYHVAGIAHQKNAPDCLYDEVNYKLAVRVARKAQEEGVKQFIFMSSGAVYSQNDRRHRILVIDEKTHLEPLTAYGISKKKAEEALFALCDKMKVAVIRPPMVYGPNTKGNYNQLRRIALSMSFFPYVNNKRSMIFIDNLCEFIRLLISTEESGVFLPQNKEYVNTSCLVKEIRKCHGLNTHLIKGLDWAIVLLGKLFNSANKAFGSFYYVKDHEYFDGSYQLVNMEESIERTENGRVL